MEIKKTINGEITVLSLIGRLDTINAPKLQEAIGKEAESATAIELDFTEVICLLSAGLRVLLLCEKMTRAEGKTMKITNVSAEVMEVFQVTGLAGVLPIY